MTVTLIAALMMVAPSTVSLSHSGARWSLTVDGKPFVVKGAGGGGSKDVLAATGANSFRTWGADTLDAELDAAKRTGLKVAVGIWLGHKEHGFRYDDPAQVQKQFEQVTAVIRKYKDNPCVLLWGIGNEMEGYQEGDDPNVWNAVEAIARAAHQIDPHHPTMTVIAEIGGKKVASIQKFCPDIDIVGINSYAGAPSIYDRYVKQGGVKPYILTEFGPRGPWESGKTAWDRPIEATSTEKAALYAQAYKSNVIDHADLCLGAYAFTWGNKQEATITWFGMLLPDGAKTAATDVMQEAWTGREPKHPCPAITGFSLDGATTISPAATVRAHLIAADPAGDPLTATWTLTTDNGVTGNNGDKEGLPDAVPGAVISSTEKQATIRMPTTPGPYRLYVIVRNAHAGAAVANVPILVR